MLKRLMTVLVLTAGFLIATQGLAATYLGNTKSMKFHFSNCSTIKYPDAPHFVTFNSRADAVAAGYEPCKRCKP